MAARNARNEGIKKVTKFVTEDGAEHLTHQQAQKHLSKIKFISWCLNSIDEDNMIDFDVEKFANKIYDNWHVTKTEFK